MVTRADTANLKQTPPSVVKDDRNIHIMTFW